MTLIIGHRGARDLWPENSLAGFRNLLDLVVDGVELDVHLTAAGEMVVIHDPTLERTTGRTGPVSELKLGEHRDVWLEPAGMGERIPDLDEVLAIYAATELEVHIEIKADAHGKRYEGLEARVAAAVAAFDMTERVFLTSFSAEVLATVRREAPRLRTLASLHGPSTECLGLRESLKALLAVADVVAVEKALLLERWDEIRALAPLDRLGVWVPNADDDLVYWLSRSLRQVTTDRPDRAVRVAGQKSQDALTGGSVPEAAA